MPRMKKGKIIPNGVILEKHEYKTILLFTERLKIVTKTKKIVDFKK